jgi:hypothetical protein
MVMHYFPLGPHSIDYLPIDDFSNSAQPDEPRSANMEIDQHQAAWRQLMLKIRLAALSIIIYFLRVLNLVLITTTTINENLFTICGATTWSIAASVGKWQSHMDIGR